MNWYRVIVWGFGGGRGCRRGWPPTRVVFAPTILLPTQERATAYLNQLKGSPEGWKFCVERFSSTPYPEVKFWCLQTLHEVR